MRGPTLALVIGIVVVVIATVVALQQLGTTPPTSQPTQPTTPPSTTQPTSPPTTQQPTTKSYDPELAEKGKKYFGELGCTACHAIRSLGISGGAVGPDLSKVLLGNPGASGSVIGRYFTENGLTNPAADPEKAAQLLAQFLQNPPQYSTTMKTQVQGYKAAYPEWEEEIVPALVEMLKEAASR